MCTTIVFDGRYMETIAEVRRKLGDANVVLQGGCTVDVIEANGCTCPVDMRATAERLHRILAVRKGGDPAEYHFLTEAEMDPERFHAVED